MSAPTWDERMCAVRIGDHAAAEIGDEMVVLDLARGRYFSLTGAAPAVWRAIERPASLDALALSVAAEFDIEAAACRPDIATLLAELEAEGLVRRVPPDEM